MNNTLYEKISKVIELTGSHDVNRYLEIGWMLLGIFQSGGQYGQSFCYVIGWNSEKGEPSYKFIERDMEKELFGE